MHSHDAIISYTLLQNYNLFLYKLFFIFIFFFLKTLGFRSNIWKMSNIRLEKITFSDMRWFSENGLKWIEIFFYPNFSIRILNSEYFFLDFKLDSIGYNWIENCISYSKFWIEQYSQLCLCAQEKLIFFFRLKGIEICSMQFL